MRPVERGDSPISGDFDDYRTAFPDLQSRLGPYCSYCERRIPTQLAVEHIQPKAIHRDLIGCWNNFLLGCVNCNSTKGDKDVRLDEALLPDRDNTFAAFVYDADGGITVNATIPPDSQAMAQLALSLPGLDRPISAVHDANGQLVAIDRVSQRMETWAIAEESKADLKSNPIAALRQQIVKTALGHGFFSIWMVVFADDPVMCRLLIDNFPGTAKDCFDATTTALVSPRPSNSLAHGGKL